jgi:hypothetical protein
VRHMLRVARMFGGLWYVGLWVGGLVVGLGGLVVWWFSTMMFKVVRVFFFVCFQG